MEEEIVPEEALKQFAETCVLTPSLLARRLGLKETDSQQIFHSHPLDRYEQIYQILLKWKQIKGQGTWIELVEATDSGLREIMGKYNKKKSRDSHTSDDLEISSKRIHRSDSTDDEQFVSDILTLEHTTTQSHITEPSSQSTLLPTESLVQPSAPPYSLVKQSIDSHSSDCNKEDELLLSYENDYAEVLQAIQYETNWYHLGVALMLPAPLLDEIEISNYRQVAECRKETIRKWLQGRGKVKPSWSGLCQALRHPLVGNISLANRLAKKMSSK